MARSAQAKRARLGNRSNPGTGRHASPQVVSLVNRIRSLVAERQRLETRAAGEQVEAKSLEILRLQWRLSNLVRRELREAGASPSIPGGNR